MKLITCSYSNKEMVGILFGTEGSEKILLINSLDMNDLGLNDFYCCPDALTMTDVIRAWSPEMESKISTLISDEALHTDASSGSISDNSSDTGNSSDSPASCSVSHAITIDLSDAELLAPIPHPAQDIICLGLNYAEHAVEAKHFDNVFEAKKAVSVYFSKRATYCPGPNAPIPSHQNLTQKLDYESELAVVIGKDAFNVAAEDVEDYIFGYTIVNDVSAREVQTGHTQWYFGKGLDGFAPMGPCITTKDEISFPPRLNIKSIINGEVRQDSNTENLIHGIDEIIAELSQGMTLKAGTVIATGTPKGVGMGMNPPTFLKPGDEVICYIEKIGELRNVVE